MFLTLLGIVLGVLLLYGLLWLGEALVDARWGLFPALPGLSLHELLLSGAVVTAGLVAGAIPSYLAYRYALSDGLTLGV